jgi:phospholipid-binding lipoprotein MlaA
MLQLSCSRRDGGHPIRTRLAIGSALAATAVTLVCSGCSRRPPEPALISQAPAAETTVPELAGGPPPSDAQAPASEASTIAATVEAASQQRQKDLSDPLQPINRRLFTADRAVTSFVANKTPVRKIMGHAPSPAKNGLANALQNLDEPRAAANHLLQRKPGVAIKAAARFLINSTVGVGGLFDVAKRMGLRHVSTDFGQTLAAYGVRPGAYLYLPVAGPTSVRDAVGAVVDGYLWPLHWVSAGGAPLQAVGLVHGLNRPALPDGPKQDAYVQVRRDYQRSRELPAEQETTLAAKRSPGGGRTAVIAAR